MPYKAIGKVVYVKKGGKWQKKATAKSVASAKRIGSDPGFQLVRLLYSKTGGV